MKSISEFEGDIVALAARLSEVPVGGSITYGELDAVIGRPVRHQRYLLLTARDRVEKDIGAIFQAIFNVGLKRIEPSAYATVGQHARRLIRSKARSANRRMTNGLRQLNDAPPEIIRAISREQSILGLIQYAARDSTMRQMLEEPIITAPPPIARVAKDLIKALGIKDDALEAAD